jgi:hypothetical protein
VEPLKPLPEEVANHCRDGRSSKQLQDVLSRLRSSWHVPPSRCRCVPPGSLVEITSTGWPAGTWRRPRGMQTQTRSGS